MMKAAGVDQAKYRLNTVIVLVAMLYSTYALYASGHSAVMGGMIVTAITFIIWGFLAPRFPQSTVRTASGRQWAEAAE
jgi:putrescine:ornithine antiporter